jgi:hypothetical protein
MHLLNHLKLRSSVFVPSLVLILIFGWACSDAAEPIGTIAGPTALSEYSLDELKVLIIAGNRQTGAPGNALSENLMVQVVDARGQGVAGVPLAWRLQRTDQGSIETTTVATDADGKSSNRWVLGSDLGKQYLDVRVRARNGHRTTFTAIASDTVADTEDPEQKESENDDADGADPSSWDFVVQDTSVVGNVTVPEGETWLFGANVEVEGNVIVRGTLAMRPGSSLRFLGANPNRYVGGGMGYEARFDGDTGLWVVRSGALDIQGTPKKGWTRSGMHATWAASDEMYIAPTATGEYEPRRWYAGDPVPRIDPRAPAAEVVNVTRDIVIEGPGHIHIHSGRAQRIEYVQLRRMGVSSNGGPVLGRYALHLHHGGDGTRGSIVRGVASVEAGGRNFVPHESHGVTMIDNVVVNSLGTGLWWDFGDHTNDLLVDSMAVLGVYLPQSLSGVKETEDGYSLGGGRNMEIRNSVASGVRGSAVHTVGFEWPNGGQIGSPAVWTFDQGNVAHNNSGPGLRFWTNLAEQHVVENYVGYRNGSTSNRLGRYPGAEVGAYLSMVRFRNIVMLGEHLDQHASARVGAGHTGLTIESPDAPAISVGARKLTEGAYWTVENCTLSSGDGHPLIYVKEPAERGHPWLAVLRNCNVTPDDVVFEKLNGGNEGSHIILEHRDGRRWEIRVQGGRKVVTTS